MELEDPCNVNDNLLILNGMDGKPTTDMVNEFNTKFPVNPFRDGTGSKPPRGGMKSNTFVFRGIKKILDDDNKLVNNGTEQIWNRPLPMIGNYENPHGSEDYENDAYVQFYLMILASQYDSTDTDIIEQKITGDFGTYWGTIYGQRDHTDRTMLFNGKRRSMKENPLNMIMSSSDKLSDDDNTRIQFYRSKDDDILSEFSSSDGHSANHRQLNAGISQFKVCNKKMNAWTSLISKWLGGLGVNAMLTTIAQKLVGELPCFSMEECAYFDTTSGTAVLQEAGLRFQVATNLIPGVEGFPCLTGDWRCSVEGLIEGLQAENYVLLDETSWSGQVTFGLINDFYKIKSETFNCEIGFELKGALALGYQHRWHKLYGGLYIGVSAVVKFCAFGLCKTENVGEDQTTATSTVTPALIADINEVKPPTPGGAMGFFVKGVFMYCKYLRLWILNFDSQV